MSQDQQAALAVAIAGLLSPWIIQICKLWIPKDWRASFALVVSMLIAGGAIAVSGGFNGGLNAVVVMSVVGVSQAVYAAVSRLVDVTTEPAPTSTRFSPALMDLVHGMTARKNDDQVRDDGLPDKPTTM